MGKECCQGKESCCAAESAQCCPDEGCGCSAQLPRELEKRINALKFFQNEHNKLEDDLRKEVRELEKKYQALKLPLYQKRLEIVTGVREPLEEESSFGGDEDEQEEQEVQDLDDEASKKSSSTATPSFQIKGIPAFWLSALMNCSAISSMIQSEDIPALKHLIDVSCNEIPEGYCIKFTFSENEFFSNSTLEKTFHFEGEIVEFAEDSFIKALGSEIQWKEGKCLTHRTVTKSQRNKKTGATRSVTETVETPSFFSFFSTLEMPEPEEAEAMDEEEEADIEQRFYEEFYLGDLLKNKIIPYAVDWFLGEASLPEDEFGNPGEYEDEDEDEEEDDDDDEDEEASSHHHHSARHNHSRGGSASSSSKSSQESGARPECKNQ